MRAHAPAIERVTPVTRRLRGAGPARTSGRRADPMSTGVPAARDRVAELVRVQLDGAPRPADAAAVASA